MLDQKIIDQLTSSAVYKQIELEADARRVEAHRVALEAIMHHEKATRPGIEKARAELTKAEEEVTRLEPGYYRAIEGRNALQSKVASLEYSAGHIREQLTNKLDEHLPAFVKQLELALLFVGNDLRAAFRVKSSWEPLAFGNGRREQVATNQAECDAAQACKDRMLSFCKDLRTKPLPSLEITEALTRELGELRKLARAVNVEIDGRLPEPFGQSGARG